MSDSPKNVDVVVVPFESHEGSLDNRGENTAKVGPLVKQNPATIKKDTPSTKQEGKKEEISTLSFNLFLYIVDKFKED